jgi:hypothetical protein
MSTFGSPQLKDPTAGWEKMIEEVADWGVMAVNELAPKVMNRPPGTKPKTKAEDHTDWELSMTDPARLQSIFESFAQTYGPINSALELLRWDREHLAIHEKGMSNGSAS